MKACLPGPLCLDVEHKAASALRRGSPGKKMATRRTGGRPRGGWSQSPDAGRLVRLHCADTRAVRSSAIFPNLDVPMRACRFLLVATIALSGLAGRAQAQQVEAVSAVDLERYAGLWYEQAHLPLFFQRNCMANTTARYTLRDDGRIDVVNQCDTDKGERIEARAIARRVGESTSKLEVRFAPAFLSFLPAVWGDYWIVDLDPDYRWAIVGSPDLKYLWILTRDKAFPKADQDALVARARALGYDTSRLVETPQR